MKISVRYFARLREDVGAEREDIDIFEGARVDDAIRLLSERHGIDIGSFPITYSVNCEHSEKGRVLHPGDELGLLFPSSGG